MTATGMSDGQRADRVITDATVIPRPGDQRVLDRGFVAITSGRIAAVGPMSDAAEWTAGAARVTAMPWAIVLPGLVNAHTHVAAGIFRGLLDDGAKGRGLYDIAFPMEQLLEPEDIHWLGLLGCIEVLKAGCTTINDIYYFADRLALAVEEIGLRAVLAEKVFDCDLPRIGQGDYTRYPDRGRERLRANVALAERWHGGASGRITVRMGTHATDTCSEPFLREASAEARRLGIGIHIHTAQSPNEIEHVRSTHGCTPVEYLDRLGMLGPSTLAAHCFHNTDADIDRMVATGTPHAYCASIYARRGRFPRLAEFRARGATTGFGTDWIRMDPWEAMRNATTATRFQTGDPDALPSHEALDLQTMGSARALGMADDIGSLEPGKKADVLVIDGRRPHLQPFYGTIPGIVNTVYPSDVSEVIVDGRTVVENGRVLTVDEGAVLAEVVRRIPRYREWRQRLSV